MQTFLPYPDFAASMKVLDYRRLGKQRVEAYQILKAIYNGGSWINHPATKMWIGYEDALVLYMNAAIDEWVNRGYKNNMVKGIIHVAELPLWVGNEEFHASHRSNLLRKDYEYYTQFGWTETEDMPYVWPVQNYERSKI